jgi:UDPglucose 6-dehydrogenase
MLILTEWDQFRALDLDRVKKALRNPVIIELRSPRRASPTSASGVADASYPRP